jgi:hypothetical protein
VPGVGPPAHLLARPLALGDGGFAAGLRRRFALRRVIRRSAAAWPRSKCKKPRGRRSFTPEFKAEIVDLCQRGDRSVGQVAKDFDLTETAVREWVKQAGT